MKFLKFQPFLAKKAKISNCSTLPKWYEPDSDYIYANDDIHAKKHYVYSNARFTWIFHFDIQIYFGSVTPTYSFSLTLR